jgi:hypothetical protein
VDFLYFSHSYDFFKVCGIVESTGEWKVKKCLSIYLWSILSQTSHNINTKFPLG